MEEDGGTGFSDELLEEEMGVLQQVQDEVLEQLLVHEELLESDLHSWQGHSEEDEEAAVQESWTEPEQEEQSGSGWQEDFLDDDLGPHGFGQRVAPQDKALVQESASVHSLQSPQVQPEDEESVGQQ